MDENKIDTLEEVTAPPMGEPETSEAESTAVSNEQIDFTKDPKITAYIEEKIQEGIQNALRGKPPRTNTVDLTEHEKKTFEKMTYKERLNLFKSNPQAYNKLTKGIN